MGLSREMKKEFEEVEKAITRLKDAEKRLNALNVPPGLFDADMQSIQAKLKRPKQVDQVEKEITLLSAKVIEYYQAREVVPASLEPAREIGTDLSRYAILQKIGVGGFSEVHKAQTADGLIVALKIPRLSSFDTFDSTDFFREAELWMKLNHPYIVKAYEYGAKPYPWIAMEYMEGGSLRDRIGTLSPREAVSVGLRLLEALFYAHHLGVIHRDIKPENVLFNLANTPKLTDWGLGKVMLETSSSVGVFKGTLAYSAPEQLSSARFGAIDWRTDIYQLAATFYEMLTNQPPFGGDIARILTEEALPPSRVNSSVPPQLDPIVMQALAKAKEDRPQDVSALIKDLKKALELGQSR